jgi:hypothetical protein
VEISRRLRQRRSAWRRRVPWAGVVLSISESWLVTEVREGSRTHTARVGREGWDRCWKSTIVDGAWYGKGSRVRSRSQGLPLRKGNLQKGEYIENGRNDSRG